MFKTKYRIVHKWTVRESAYPGVNNIAPEKVNDHYIIEYKNLRTILLPGDIWSRLTLETFTTLSNAEKYLQTYLIEHYSKKFEKHYSKVEYTTKGY